MGLSQEAKNFLGRYKKQGPICPTCKRCTYQEPKVIDTFESCYSGTFPLYRHQLTEGHADEFLQASPWDSGPMFYIGLHIYKANGELEGTIEWANL
jgi:hypothetical protein